MKDFSLLVDFDTDFVSPEMFWDDILDFCFLEVLKEDNNTFLINKTFRIKSTHGIKNV